MEPISKGKQILTDIEKSIENALALFNTKDLEGGINQIIDVDPIVSLHVNKSNEKNKVSNDFRIHDDSQIKSQSEVKAHTRNKSPLTLTDTLHDSPRLPFLKDPIKTTIEEMQRVLNAKGDAQSTCNVPTPEEILELYSQDLGICLSSNSSPRGDTNNLQQLSKEKEIKKTKSIKKGKLTSKKQKLQNFANINHKKEINSKLKASKSESIPSKENKVRELINIYGCEKNTKIQSNSTSGSKKGINSSLKQFTHTNNSCKSSSITKSKRGKKKKKNLKNSSIDIAGSEVDALEKSSRIGIKRPLTQKNIFAKSLLKKPNYKRKIRLSSNENSLDLKSSNSHQTTYKMQYNDINNNKQNLSMKNEHLKESNKNTDRIKMKNPSKSSIKDISKPMAACNKTVLKAITNTNYYNRFHNNSNVSNTDMSEMLSETIIKKSTSVTKQAANGTLSNNIGQKHFENIKVNKFPMFDDKYPYNSVADSQPSSEMMTKDLNGLMTQMHYLMPTQSSRSKEVERFLNDHYQHLPFVIGQSTNKSHNLWVNIQEALSLIKQKVPQTAEIENDAYDVASDRPMSVLSKLTNKSGKKTHACPALVVDGLYDIPEAEAEEGEPKSWEDHPDCIQANIDPRNVRPRCSCLQQPSLSYRKVLRQIFGGGADISQTSIGSNGTRKDLLQDHEDSYIAELKKLLIDLTQEFEDLNNKYEEMLIDTNASKDELQRLALMLENKEEEIKEILTRFNEVKEINGKVRSDDAKSRIALHNIESFKSTTSIRLAQTLRRVQQFKESLRRSPSGHYMSKSVYAQSLY